MSDEVQRPYIPEHGNQQAYLSPPKSDNSPAESSYRDPQTDFDDQNHEWRGVSSQNNEFANAEQHTDTPSNIQTALFKLKKNMYTAGRRNDAVPYQIQPGDRRLSSSSVSEDKTSEETNEQNEIEELKGQIKDVTKQITKVYNSYQGTNNESLGSTELDQTLLKENKPGLVRELEKSYASIEILKERLKTEAAVRKQMIRYLADAKLQNTIKTRAMQALVSYYKPTRDTLHRISKEDSQQRSILDAKIRMLPRAKRLEFQRRIDSIRKARTRKISNN